MNPEYILTVDDVYRVVQQHLAALDKEWPDNEPVGSGAIPTKKQVVELIEGIKLRLAQTAEDNLNRHDSPFERAAKKIMGTPAKAPVEAPKPPELNQKTAMQLAHEAAQARMRARAT